VLFFLPQFPKDIAAYPVLLTQNLKQAWWAMAGSVFCPASSTSIVFFGHFSFSPREKLRSVGVLSGAAPRPSSTSGASALIMPFGRNPPR
jgi:hypothetical protein